MTRKFIRCFTLPASQNEEILLELMEEKWKYSLEFHWVSQLNWGKSQFLTEWIEDKNAIEQYWEYRTRMYSRGTEWKSYKDWLKTNYKVKK